MHVVAEHLKTVNEGMFSDSMLQDLFCPKLISIGQNGFFKSKLKQINLLSLQVVNEGAFKNCVFLELAVLPNVRQVMNFAFKNCSQLKEANFPLLELLGQGAFQDCDKLNKACFPHLLEVKASTFKNCESLAEIVFNSVEKVGNNAFAGCVGINSIM